MTEAIQQVRNAGIYKALPVIPDDVKGLSAIIVGANGISGAGMLKTLLQSPERWSKIYTISRTPPAGEMPKHVEHVAQDLLNASPEEIAATFKSRGVKADYIFFYAFVHLSPTTGKDKWFDSDKVLQVNTALVRNFLYALPLASIQPKRFMLQTGGRYYGVHLGPAPAPLIESNPRVTIEPNWYYSQEDVLFEFCANHNIQWVTIRPCNVIGAVLGTTADSTWCMAAYAAVQKKLGRKLSFPSNFNAWECQVSQSDGVLNGYLAEWAVLSPHTGNQTYNATDDSAFTWSSFWPHLAAWYGLEWEGPSTDPAAFTEMKTTHDPPPRGYGPLATFCFKFRLAEWAKSPEVQAAWQELVDEHGLLPNLFHDPDHSMLIGDFGLAMPFATHLSTCKRRSYGFHGYVNSIDSFYASLDEHVSLKLIPPVPRAHLNNPTYQPYDKDWASRE